MASPLQHDYMGLSSNEEQLGTELRLGLPGSESPERKEMVGLSLGLPKSSVSGAKRGFLDTVDGARNWDFSDGGGAGMELGKGDVLVSPKGENGDGEIVGTEKKAQVSSAAPAAKAHVVGWPPIRSYWKNTMAADPSKNKDCPGFGGLFVKVSMDGAPYLRKVDLKTYCNYKELSVALENMFSCFTIGECTSQGIQGSERLSHCRLLDLLHKSEFVVTYEDKDGDWMLVGDVPWDMFTNTCRRLRIMKGSDAIGLAPRAMERCKNQNDIKNGKPKPM